MQLCPANSLQALCLDHSNSLAQVYSSPSVLSDEHPADGLFTVVEDWPTRASQREEYPVCQVTTTIVPSSLVFKSCSVPEVEPIRHSYSCYWKARYAESRLLLESCDDIVKADSVSIRDCRHGNRQGKSMREEPENRMITRSSLLPRGLKLS